MNKIILIIFTLSLCFKLNADDCSSQLIDQWKNYLQSYSDKIGSNILNILKNNKCEGQFKFFKYIHESDFSILDKKIKKNNLIAFEIALNLLNYSDGAYTEILLGSLAKLININPSQFLFITKKYQFYNKEYLLESILINDFPNLSEEIDDRIKIITDRFDALKSVNIYKINDHKTKCLKILSNELAKYKEQKEFSKLSELSKINRNYTLGVSSERFHKNKMYSFKNLIDNDKTTAWVAGGNKCGINEKIKLKFPNNIFIQSIRILNGLQKNEFLYKANNRLRKIKVNYCDNYILQSLPDSTDWQTIMIGNKTKEIDIEILSVYEGNKYPEDTCISEIEVISE